MQKVALTLLVAVIFGLGSAGCEKHEEEGARAPAARVGNADLENSIRIRFAADEQLKTAKLKIDADKDKRVVTLSGTVDSESLRDKAIDLAKSAQPQLTVKDQIDVTPAEVRRDDDLAASQAQ